MSDESARASAPPCPKCNSSHVVPVVFGLYDDAGLAALRREYGDHGFVIGGCCPTDWDWSCKVCGEMFAGTAPTAFSDANEKITYHEWAERQQKIIDRMKGEGTLPTLEEFAKAVEGVRKEYLPKMLADRADKKQRRQHKRNGHSDSGGHQ